LRSKLYEKREKRWFQFLIVIFPIIYRNIPATLIYEVYISQQIRYSRISVSYKDFFDKMLLLMRKPLSQVLLVVKFK
jgi:hypothetical protein